jgi:hypothetical protein
MGAGVGSGLRIGLLVTGEAILMEETRLELDREGGKDGKKELNSIMGM